MLVNGNAPSPLIPESSTSLPCSVLPADEDRVLRELFAAGGHLPSDAEGKEPSLRRNLSVKMSADNLYCCITCLKNDGYVETTLIAQTDQWLRHYRPIKVALTERGRHHVMTTSPARGDRTLMLTCILLSGILIALLKDLIGDPAYGTVGIFMVAAAVIALVLRRAGQLYFGKYPRT